MKTVYGKVKIKSGKDILVKKEVETPFIVELALAKTLLYIFVKKRPRENTLFN